VLLIACNCNATGLVECIAEGQLSSWCRLKEQLSELSTSPLFALLEILVAAWGYPICPSRNMCNPDHGVSFIAEQASAKAYNQDSRGNTPLHYAASHGNERITRQLFNMNALIGGIRKKDETQSSHSKAMFASHFDFEAAKHGIKWMVSQGNKNGDTPLMIVADGGYIDYCLVMLEWLRATNDEGDRRWIRQLQERTNLYGNSFFSMVYRRGDTELLQFLLVNEMVTMTGEDVECCGEMLELARDNVKLSRWGAQRVETAITECHQLLEKEAAHVADLHMTQLLKELEDEEKLSRGKLSNAPSHRSKRLKRKRQTNESKPTISLMPDMTTGEHYKLKSHASVDTGLGGREDTFTTATPASDEESTRKSPSALDLRHGVVVQFFLVLIQQAQQRR
jgi:Ankyrin repeat